MTELRVEPRGNRHNTGGEVTAQRARRLEGEERSAASDGLSSEEFRAAFRNRPAGWR